MFGSVFSVFGKDRTNVFALIRDNKSTNRACFLLKNVLLAIVVIALNW